MQQKIEKNFFHSEIIAFELAAINFITNRVLVIGCQSVNKQS